METENFEQHISNKQRFTFIVSKLFMCLCVSAVRYSQPNRIFLIPNPFGPAHAPGAGIRPRRLFER